jgi:sulfur-oxidizing protein SoxY
MKVNRRQFLKTTLALGATGIAFLESPAANSGWLAADFAPSPFDATMKQLPKGKPIVETDKIELTIPEIAENGALVPVTVTSSINDIRRISLVVEKNPVPLIIQADLMSELETFMSARLKLAETSFVHALAETNTTCYRTKKLVKVTIGGCGG